MVVEVEEVEVLVALSAVNVYFDALTDIISVAAAKKFGH